MRRTTLVLALLLSLGAGCAETPDSAAPPAATQPAAPTTSGTDPATDPQSASCPGDTDPSSHEESAECLYEAFLADDRELAESYATATAVDQMFELGGFPEDDRWTFEECGSPRETTPSSGVACHFTIPGDVHDVYVEMQMRDDYVVEAVQSIG